MYQQRPRKVVYPRTPGWFSSDTLREAWFNWSRLVEFEGLTVVAFKIAASSTSTRFVMVYDHRREIVKFVKIRNDGCPLYWKTNNAADIEIVEKGGYTFVNLYDFTGSLSVLGCRLYEHRGASRKVLESNPAWVVSIPSRRVDDFIIMELTDETHRVVYTGPTGARITVDNDLKIE